MGRPYEHIMKIYVDVIEPACSVRTGEILVEFSFCKFMDQAAGVCSDTLAELSNFRKF